MADTALVHIRRAYERFLAGAEPSAETVRSVVRDSWLRSAARGVDPAGTESQAAGSELRGDRFTEYRAAHLMTSVRGLVRSLMLDDLAESGVVVALTDHDGRLLWVEGDRSARDRAAAINFVEGSVWSEDTVGTNAPGLALAINRGVQVLGPEHFASSVHEWNCAAAPVHDPVTGELLGAIDVTGGPVAAAPFALAAVRSVVAAVELALGARAVDLSAPAATPSGGNPHLSVLNGLRWTAPGSAPLSLSPRHAEILLLLVAHPEGLSADQLAVLLSAEDLGSVTIRAEISRLRRELGEVIAARPYRLATELTTDVGELRALIDRDLPAAIQALRGGGLLASSTAPGIADLFEELLEDLRSRVIVSGDSRALAAWTASPYGRDDTAAWHRLTTVLPTDDPQRAVAAGRVRLADRRYGLR